MGNGIGIYGNSDIHGLTDEDKALLDQLVVEAILASDVTREIIKREVREENEVRNQTRPSESKTRPEGLLLQLVKDRERGRALADQVRRDTEALLTRLKKPISG
jgi:hypothetical protein